MRQGMKMGSNGKNIENLGSLSRTHTCGELRPEHAGSQVVLMGWVNRRRDFGPLTFVDLRDRAGLCQVVVDEERNPEAHRLAKLLRPEWVVAIEGKVVMRDADKQNANMPTGKIEVIAQSVRIVSDAKTPPFEIGGDKANEDLRLKYRYLDLRSGRMQRNIRIRHDVAFATRRYLDRNRFLEIETPMLIRSTPEGARDYVVPSRVSPGNFYALPQSPQIFKQLLMIGGYDRYFQIVRCFRDEDLRADRQPEFTQVDIEMSFVAPDDVFTLVEGLMVEVCKPHGIEAHLPFPRMTYAEAIARYGSDKPDTRFDMELQDVSAAFDGSDFKVYADVVAAGGKVLAIAATVLVSPLLEYAPGVCGLVFAVAFLSSYLYLGPPENADFGLWMGLVFFLCFDLRARQSVANSPGCRTCFMLGAPFKLKPTAPSACSS